MIFPKILIDLFFAMQSYLAADLNNIFATHKSLLIANEVSFGTAGCRGDNSASKQSRRLVSPLHAGRKFGHRDISGRDA